MAFYGGYGEEQDRLVHAELAETSVKQTDVGRGSRIYVQAEPFTEWGVFDLSS
ncbi:hypothetical protein [Streptomyces sp. PTY087I2]|uniref:hypothetical protein n=1 Tax=Streptomyces sp. PTY087I2 TaxID=1819298 RepID=UPI00210054B3|nr:hypothetical protein [Streptomyces sp. PTY087I2]